MEATQAQLLNLLDGKKQFTIPIYQRTYSWHLKQCEQLLRDIIRIGQDNSSLSHFIGSVVYFKPSSSPITSVPEFLVIDGQQRLTTVSLLLLALTHVLKAHDDVELLDESWEEIQETYLVNKHKKNDSKYKLLLTRRDKDTYIRLVNEIDLPDHYSQKVVENYAFFKERITPENLQTIYYGVRKLIIVDVILEQGKDDPQLIFESLNSTGLDLTQADLIRNFVLMRQPIDVQSDLYERYWYPMEQSFGEQIEQIAWFIRDYLTMKEGTIPKIGLVYETYKKFMAAPAQASQPVEAIIKDLYRYSKYYVRLALQRESDSELLKKFREIVRLKMDTSYPFLLAIYGDYEEGFIDKVAFLEIITIVANYVFRRAICGIPTNSLNKTFATLYKKVNKTNYLESVKAAFLLLGEKRRFPSDAEFIKELAIKDVYNFRSRNYLLESLENWQYKEPINAENYTIEHVLPQNTDLPQAWQNELGNNWQQVQEKYLHTLGNLTLTGYNSELSDRPFKDKKSMEGGFDKSPLYLNESVREASQWNETAIIRRASILTRRACEVWGKPQLSGKVLDAYRNPQAKGQGVTYGINHFDFLTGEMLDLYQKLEKRILNLDSSVRVEFKKLYIAFKSQSNFVDVEPQKKQLKLSLNMAFADVHDPKGYCRDMAGIGKWGNGDVSLGIDTAENLDAVMYLIGQAFEAQETVI